MGTFSTTANPKSTNGLGGSYQDADYQSPQPNDIVVIVLRVSIIILSSLLLLFLMFMLVRTLINRRREKNKKSEKKNKKRKIRTSDTLFDIPSIESMDRNPSSLKPCSPTDGDIYEHCTANEGSSESQFTSNVQSQFTTNTDRVLDALLEATPPPPVGKAPEPLKKIEENKFVPSAGSHAVSTRSKSADDLEYI